MYRQAVLCWSARTPLSRRSTATSICNRRSLHDRYKILRRYWRRGICPWISGVQQRRRIRRRLKAVAVDGDYISEVVPQWEVLAADSGGGTAVEGRAGGAGSECKRGRRLTGPWGALGIACINALFPLSFSAAALGSCVALIAFLGRINSFFYY